MDIEGRLVQKLAIQQGTSARGNWAKQEFVIEYQEGNFPTKACFSVWGADKVKDLERFQIGDQIKVAFNVSSREFNGKWYTDLRAWRISPAGTPAYGQDAQQYGQPASGYGQTPSYGQATPSYGHSPSQAQATPNAYQDAPAGFAPAFSQPQHSPAPTLADMPEDDLPF